MPSLREKLRKVTVGKLLTFGLFLLVFAGFLGMGLEAMTPVANAQSEFCGTISDEFSGFIDCNQGFTSFTQFDTGGLQPVSGEGFDPGLTRAADARTFIKNVVNFALSFLGLIALVITIYGGFLYVTSAGNDDQAGKGKQVITYAIIGILIILGSFAIVNTVIRAPGDIGSGGTGGSGGTSQSNTQQLANYNGASEEVKGATVEFIRAYEDYFNQNVLIQKMMTYRVNKLTTRQEFTDYLTSVRQILVQLERESVPPLRSGDIRVSNTSLSNTALAARIIIDNVIDPALQVLSNIIDTEYDQQEIAEVYNTFIKDVTDSLLSAGDSIGEFFAGFNPNNPQKQLQDINCYLRPELRSIQGEFDCVGIRETTDRNFGSDVVARMNLFLDAVLIQKGINVDYNERIEEISDRVLDIRDSLSNFGTVQATQAVDEAFNEVIDYLGRVRAENIAYEINLSRDEVTSTNLSASQAFNNTANVRELIKAFSDLNEVLKEIRFVAAFIRANATSGNAPLVVQFDASSSYDPADQSLTDPNFEWDLDGNGVFGSISTANIENVRDCREEKSTIVSCTYKRPGAYRVALRATSNQPSAVAPGLAYITITVQEPVAKIDVRAIVNGEEEVIRSYNESGFIERDVDEIKVTLNSASAGEGIAFDARGTAQASEGARIVSYSWDFGDNSPRLTGSEQEAGRVAHVYNTNGDYRVLLEVQDEAGNRDRKIFNVNVTSLAANVHTNQTRGDLNTEFVFDAGRSRSDGGDITQYNWSIAGVTDIDPENAPVFRHRFSQPGNYTVTLQIQDSAGNNATASVQVLVESQTPKAAFTSEFLPNQPSTVILDATSSYDPDSSDTLNYQWTIFNAREGTDFEILDGALKGNNAEAAKIKVKFKKQRNYLVELKVADQYEDERLRKEASVQADVNIQTLVDLALGDDHQRAAILSNGQANVTFHLLSDFAKTVQIDFGDGSSDAGAFTNGSFKINHTYTQARLYKAIITAYGTEGDENTVQTTIAVGRGDSVIPIVELEYNGLTYQLDDTLPIISRNQSIRLRADKSLNNDGSKTGLTYSWNFGDGKFGEGANVTHTFTELAPNPPGYFEITLQVTNRENKQEQTNFTLKVQSVPPVIQGVKAEPLNATDKSVAADTSALVTPFPVRVSAEGANDPDGTISEYRFYYFPVLDPGRKLGVKISKDPVAELEVDTLGIEGDRNEFAFCVDIKDNEGNEVVCQTRFDLDELPKVTATNGKNTAPVASFVADRTNIFVGEEINFNSTSTDADGQIVSYQWDIDGDGSFANDAPQTAKTLTHTYTRRSNESGYRVRLRVVDDKGATAISEPVTIFVDSVLNPPVAAFTTQSAGAGKIRFVNNSRADTAKGGNIARSLWDFDLNLDSDGDGDKTNDINAETEAPTYTYPQPGSYQAKLTIVDTEGNTDEITNTINVTEFAVGSVEQSPLANAAGLQAFLRSTPAIDPVTKTIYLSGSTGNISFYFDQSVGNIRRFIVDKNIFFDTNSGQPNTPGDGIRNNDSDFETTNKNATYTTDFNIAWEPIELQLTVVDAQGNVSRDTVKVSFGRNPNQASLALDTRTTLTVLATIAVVGVLLYVTTHYLDRKRPRRKTAKLNK